MDEVHAARLIPASGIGGPDEQERRATSAVLAVLAAVKEFSRAILIPLGAPTGRVETFIEVPFELADARHIPDGVIRVTRGSRSWTALVEVKTGSNSLLAPQLENYLEVARQNRFDALLTISNEIPTSPGAHPTAIDRRKLRGIPLHHLSWTQVLTVAVMQKQFRGVSDPDQAWILGELIRYLEHPRSGALDFEDMGPSWPAVRDAVTQGALRPNDKAAVAVALRWDQLVQFLCLRLGRQLGVEVQPGVSRKDFLDPARRVQALVARLSGSGMLDGGVRVPGAVSPISLVADVRAGRLTVSIDIDAPRDGRGQTRVNWLLRQVKESPRNLRIDTYLAHGRSAACSELLEAAMLKPRLLVGAADKEIKSFHLSQSAPLGTKRGAGRGSFVGAATELLEDFYLTTVQGLKAWSPPRLRAEVVTPDVSEQLASTSLSSQDGPATTSAISVPTPNDPPTARARSDEARSSISDTPL